MFRCPRAQRAVRARESEALPRSARVFYPACARREVFGSSAGGCDATKSEWSRSDVPWESEWVHGLTRANQREERVISDERCARTSEHHDEAEYVEARRCGCTQRREDRA